MPPLPEGVTLEQLFDFSKLHNVEALVHRGLSTLGQDDSDPVWRNWENRASMLLAQGIVQLSERDLLFGVLTEAGIPLLPVKGCWLKELYPSLELRQMSDLDMLIPPDREGEAKNLMLSLGYKTEAFEDTSNHVSFFKPPYTEVELHNSLLPEDNGYYDGVWQRAQRVEGFPCLYRFSPEDEYIYYLLHLNKHLEDAGTGIRSVLDSVVYRREWPDMDREYLRRELEPLGLWQRTADIEALADCWFVRGGDLPEALYALADRILGSGTFGSTENRSRDRLEKLEQKYKNPLIRGLVYWAQRICRPREELIHSYPVLKKAPFLLPVFWIYRAVMKFVRHPKEIWLHIKLVFAKEENHG